MKILAVLLREQTPCTPCSHPYKGTRLFYCLHRNNTLKATKQTEFMAAELSLGNHVLSFRLNGHRRKIGKKGRGDDYVK